MFPNLRYNSLIKCKTLNKLADAIPVTPEVGVQMLMTLGDVCEPQVSDRRGLGVCVSRIQVAPQTDIHPCICRRRMTETAGVYDKEKAKWKGRETERRARQMKDEVWVFANALVSYCSSTVPLGDKLLSLDKKLQTWVLSDNWHALPCCFHIVLTKLTVSLSFALYER